MNTKQQKGQSKRVARKGPYRTQFGFVDFSIEARARLKEGKQ